MNRSRYWAIVPAAGIGKRMGAEVPKQYLPLAGKTVIEHTLHRLSQNPQISEIIVVLAKDDPYWPELKLDWVATSLSTVIGGNERCDSELNGMQSLNKKAEKDDWVLVHDAARPCIRLNDVRNLITACEQQEASISGAILGMPVKDSMKQSDEALCVEHSLAREHIWHALTPQMFRFRDLETSLSSALNKGLQITDEAMAMESAGFKTKLVQGHSDNIKITNPEDLALAEFYLQQQSLNGVSGFDDGMSDGG